MYIDNPCRGREQKEVIKVTDTRRLRAKVRHILSENEGQFPARTNGYPACYIATDGDILCAECATRYPGDILRQDYNECDTNLHCDHCGKHIPN